MSNILFSIFPSENFIDLGLYQYGWERCDPAHSFGPVARNHYLFHYVISGTGTHTAQNSSGDSITYKIRSGQGFMIFPHQICTYIADNELPWEYVWLEFDGLRVREYLTAAGLDDAHPIYVPQSPAQGQATRDIMLYITNHPKASTLHLIGQLFLFLDALIQSSSTRRAAGGGPLRDFYIQEAVTYMEQNFQRDLTVEELSDVCKLNRSYFSKLFKETMGCPPQEFLIRMRLSKATELMRTSRASIGDIAQLCGYPNQLHFSRAFKKRYGVSPREWRRDNQIRAKG